MNRRQTTVLRGIRAGRPEIGPSNIHIDVTNGCNAACLACWDHSPLLDAPRSPEWKSRRLPIERFREIIAELAALGSVRHVILSGMGEPFTHPQIYEMIAEIRRRGWELTVITNLAAADTGRMQGISQLLVGVHGVTPDTYTRFHAGWTEEHFFRVCAALRRLSRSLTRVRHVQVITRDTAAEIVDMVRFGALFGADRVTYKLAALRGGTEAAAIDEDQRRWLLEEGLPAASELAGSLGVPTNLPLFESQVRAGGGATARIERVGCYMGYSYARITVDEEILFCCNGEVSVGSLRELPFAAWWAGPEWQALRAEVAAGRYYTGCDQCGKLEQNIRWAERLRRCRDAVVPVPG